MPSTLSLTPPRLRRTTPLTCLLALCLLLAWTGSVVSATGNVGTFTEVANRNATCGVEHCKTCAGETVCRVCDDFYLETPEGGCTYWCVAEHCYSCYSDDASACVLCDAGYRPNAAKQCEPYQFVDDITSIHADGAHKCWGSTLLGAVVVLATVALSCV